MFVSKLSFTKETEDKMNKKLTAKERGKLRWQKLEEANEKGRLAMCKNRYEVANLAGYPENKRREGYMWVTGLINRGKISEVMSGKNGLYYEYNYFIKDKPNYLPFAGRYGSDATKKKKDNTVEITKEKKMSPRDAGLIKWNAIKKLEASGRLKQIRDRNELAREIGYEDSKRGYSYVCNLIHRGYLSEKVINDRGERIFSVTGEPDYGYEKKKSRSSRKDEHAVVEESREQNDVVLRDTIYVKPTAKLELEQPKGANTKLTITVNGVTLVIENVTEDVTMGIVERVFERRTDEKQ